MYILMYLHTGWRILMGSPKLQIIFHKRATKYRSLLWKMTYKNKGSYESSPSFTFISIITEKFLKVNPSLSLSPSVSEYIYV